MVGTTRRGPSWQLLLAMALCLAASASLAAAAILAVDRLGTGEVAVGSPSSSSEPSPASETGGQPADVFELRVGDCIAEDLGTDIEVWTVPIIGCDEPHAHEVFHAFELTDLGEDYPGAEAIEEEAWLACAAAFEEFTGQRYATSIYDFTFLAPTEETWDEVADREVMCLVFNFDGTLKTGSARRGTI